MLMLTRKNGEKIIINDNIWITVIEIGHGMVRLRIEGPDGMKVERDEIRRRDHATRNDKTDARS